MKLRGGGMTTALRHREFRLLFAGQLISNLGDWLDFLALVVLIAYVWHHGAAALAALAIVVAVPWIAVAPVAGVLADRWPKRSVMIGSDLTRAVIVIGLVFAPNLAVLLVLAGLKTTVSTLFNPSEQATIRTVVPDDELYAANALSQFVLQSTKVVGPALGGLLVSLTSPRAAFAVDAATFLASAAILSQMRPIESLVSRGGVATPAGDDGATPPEEGGGTASDAAAEPGFWRELREGLAYVARRRALVVAIASMSAATFLLLAFDTLSPLAFMQLGAGKSLFGLAVAALGLGGVLGAVAIGRHGQAFNPFVVLGGAKILIGGLVGLIGAVLLGAARPAPEVWLPVLLVVGFAAAGVLVSAPTILQRETPPELMGRVSASANAVPTIFQITAPIAGAAVAAWQSVGFVFAVSGAALAGLGLIVVILRPSVGRGVPSVNDEAPASPVRNGPKRPNGPNGSAV